MLGACGHQPVLTYPVQVSNLPCPGQRVFLEICPMDTSDSYIIDRSTNEKIYWRCMKYFSDRCRFRLHTCTLTNVSVKTPTEHTCKVDGTTLQLSIFNERIVHRALNTQETPDTTTTSCFRGKNKSFFFSNIFFYLLVDMLDPSIARLPVRDNIKRRVRILRQKNQVVKEPNDLNFASVPTPLTETIHGNQFLRCDTGSGTSTNTY